MNRPALRSIGGAIALSQLVALMTLVAETMHLARRSAYFVADLGAGITFVLAWYIGVALVVGAVVGAAVRSTRGQAWAVSCFFYTMVSLKVLWISARLLAVPSIAGVFVVFSILLIGSAILLARRLALSAVFPILFVAFYTNICLGIAARWAFAGGQLLPFFLAPKTLAIVGLGSVGMIVATLLQVWLERRKRAWLRFAVPAAMVVAMMFAILWSSRRIPRAQGPEAAVSEESPDIYVLSFDAMRSDELRAFIDTHPNSHLAGLAARSSVFENIVSHGTSTETILTNNTFRSSGSVRCKDSLPAKLASRGYFTAMIFGVLGRRFDGSICYRYFYSGGGRLMTRKYALPAVFAGVGASPQAFRLRALNAPLLINTLRDVVRVPEPVFAYLHFLELHGPYVPSSRQTDATYMAALEKYMTTCYVIACDPTRPENATLIAQVRGAYQQLLLQVDKTVGAAIAVIEQRHRPYRLVITADHGELFGEHGGYAHADGFVPELLDIPFIVFDSRSPVHVTHCELMLEDEALDVVATEPASPGKPLPDHDVLQWSAQPLGSASITKANEQLHFTLADGMLAHAGSARNIHREASGDVSYPIARCTH